jgi:hypothetical protein
MNVSLALCTASRYLAASASVQKPRGSGLRERPDSMKTGNVLPPDHWSSVGTQSAPSFVLLGLPSGLNRAGSGTSSTPPVASVVFDSRWSRR